MKMKQRKSQHLNVIIMKGSTDQNTTVHCFWDFTTDKLIFVTLESHSFLFWSIVNVSALLPFITDLNNFDFTDQMILIKCKKKKKNSSNF